jgi:hypothetical protein
MKSRKLKQRKMLPASHKSLKQNRNKSIAPLYMNALAKDLRASSNSSLGSTNHSILS